MKTFSKILALVLVLCMVVVLLLSCNKEEKYAEVALKHLETKYETKEFEVKNIVREGNTSGRYVVDAVCDDDNVHFNVFVYSSLLISDGYSVEKANAVMREQFKNTLADNLLEDYVSDVEWLRIYNEPHTDYSFVDVDDPESVTVDKVENIYKLKFVNGLTLEKVSQLIIDCSDAFSEDFGSLESITYEFELDGLKYDATFPVSVTNSKTAEDVQVFLKQKIESKSSDGNAAFYWQETEAIVITVEDESTSIETTEQTDAVSDTKRR